MLDIGGTDNVPLPNVPSTSLPSRPGIKLFKCVTFIEFNEKMEIISIPALSA